MSVLVFETHQLSEDNIAATHTTPGAILRNSANAGLIASGNKVVTTRKKMSGCST